MSETKTRTRIELAYRKVRLSGGGAWHYRWDCPLGCDPQVYAIVKDWRDLDVMVAEHYADAHPLALATPDTSPGAAGGGSE